MKPNRLKESIKQKMPSLNQAAIFFTTFFTRFLKLLTFFVETPFLN